MEHFPKTFQGFEWLFSISREETPTTRIFLIRPYTSHHVIKVISKSAFLKSRGLSFRRTDIDTSFLTKERENRKFSSSWQHFDNLTCILSSTDMCISVFSLFYKIAASKRNFDFLTTIMGPFNRGLLEICKFFDYVKMTFLQSGKPSLVSTTTLNNISKPILKKSRIERNFEFLTKNHGVTPSVKCKIFD